MPQAASVAGSHLCRAPMQRPRRLPAGQPCASAPAHYPSDRVRAPARSAVRQRRNSMSITEQIRPAPKSDLRLARMLVGGEWVDSQAGETLTVENPAKRQPIARVPRGRKADVDRAAQAAAQAFPAWSRVVPRDRGRILLRIAEALEARVDELGRLIALETGNALRTQALPEARM